MFDLGRLRLLRELSHLGTMTAVAAANRLSPSAVSQQLATLEAEVRLKLFEPVGRRVRLTAAGLRLVAHAETILAAVDAARIDMGSAATVPGGRLEVACFGSFAKSHLLPAAIRVRGSHPGLEIVVHELEPVDALEAVRSGRCHAAIVYSHSLVPRAADPALTLHRLVDEPILLALPASLAHLPETVGLADLAACDWIGGSRESEGYTLTTRACAVAGFVPRITHSIDDYDLLLRLVAAGLGISFVPRLALDLYRSDDLAIRTPAGPPLRRNIDAVARPIISASPSFHALLAELQTA